MVRSVGLAYRGGCELDEMDLCGNSVPNSFRPLVNFAPHTECLRYHTSHVSVKYCGRGEGVKWKEEYEGSLSTHSSCG